MTAFKFALLGLCLAALAMTTGCGRKGDPAPPAAVEETTEEEKVEKDY